MGRQRLKILENEVLALTIPKAKEIIGGNSAMRSFMARIPHQILLESSSAGWAGCEASMGGRVYIKFWQENLEERTTGKI
jgi:hypothetical protein